MADSTAADPATTGAPCPACGGPMPALARLRRLLHCGRPACLLAAERQGSANRKAAQEQAARRALARRHGPAKAASAAVVWLAPHGATGTVATTAPEREAFAAHLLACAQGQSLRPQVQPDPRWQAPAPVDRSPTAASACATQAHSLCAGCGGRCCRIGLASHAFIDTGLLQRWTARHPGSSAGHAVQAYLDRLPRRHVQSSCLFHTDEGCALPREDRSAVCNNFECDGLVEAKSALAAEPGASLVALVGTNGHAERGFWVDLNGQRHRLRTRR